MLPKAPDLYKSLKLICGLSGEIEKMIQYFIQDKFEGIVNRRLSDIEKTIQNHDKGIKSIKNEMTELKNSISDLMEIAEKNNSKQKGSRDSVGNEVSFINPQVLFISKKSNNRHSRIDKNIDIQINQLREKIKSLLERPNNPDTEEEFRKTSSQYENQLRGDRLSITPLNEAYQDYINAYHKNASLYLTSSVNNQTNLLIYDTESEIKDEKIIETPELLDSSTCIAQLPNNSLFCFGKKDPASGISLIIDNNNKVRRLPTGTSCSFSSAIYFNRNIYCFGGQNYNGYSLSLSERFDLAENRWKKLEPMPQTDYSCCCCVVNNENIYIAGTKNKNILKYSIDDNAFTIIPFEFAIGKRKIMINEERLYLIECRGMVYECEDKRYNAWKRIGRSNIGENCPDQVYCSYNKWAVYIGLISFSSDHEFHGCYKFDLLEKEMNKLQEIKF